MHSPRDPIPLGFSYLPMQNDAVYICNDCGEEIVVPIDLSAGHIQHYVEDCPVCCRPWSVRVEWFEGQARVDLQTEDESGF